MPLPSFLKRFRAGRANERVASAAAPSEAARTRARRRLIGAAVLVAAGVIGFPVLFDSQPRPLPSDLPIVMPHKDGGHEIEVPRVADAPAINRVDEPAAAAHPMTEAAVSAAAASVAAPASLANDATQRHEVSDKPVDASAKPDATPDASVKPIAKPSIKPTVKPTAKTIAKPQALKPAHEPAPAGKSDAARARALLNGQDASVSAASSDRPASAVDARYIVQIGAFADVPKAHEARIRVEKLGLKTYTQVVSGDGGKRIRVRVGPFPDKESAEKAATKIRQSGLTAAILTL